MCTTHPSYNTNVLVLSFLLCFLYFSTNRIKKTLNIILDIVCWFDGAAQLNDTLCGARGIIKTTGKTSYIWTLNCGQGTNTKAKLLGVWASLTLAHWLNIAHLYVPGDSNIVIDWITHFCSL